MYVGLMSVSAVLREHGFEAEVLISSDEETIVRRVLSKPYRLIGSPVMWGEGKMVFRQARAIKNACPQAKIILGGVYPTLQPEEAMANTAVDYLCQGEGEYPVLELIEALAHNKETHNIPNVWARTNGRVHRNPMRPLNDLDDLPFSDVDFYREYPYFFKSSFRMAAFSRGCPFTCSFCYNELFRKCYKGLGPYLRTKSPQRAVEELKFFSKSHPIKRIFINDDNLVNDRNFLREFAELVSPLGIGFFAQGRASQIDAETSGLLARCNVKCFAVAVESGDEEYRHQILDKRVTDEDILNAARHLQRAGIRVFLRGMIAMPNETVDMALKTIDLMIRAKVTLAVNAFYIPYPGVGLSERARNIYKLDNSFFEDLLMNSPLDPVLPVAEKNTMKNIHHLTAFMVRFPVFRPLLPFLIRLPPNPVYDFIYHVMRIYVQRKATGFSLRLILHYSFSVLTRK
jgi:radical SAM superfamily enzyme YgiQ (UPF0313 family)